MSNLLYFVIGKLSGKEGAGLDIRKLLDQAPPSVRREFGAEIEKLIEIFQVMSFAPDEAVGNLKDPAEMKKNLQRANEVLSKSISLADQDEKSS